MSADATFWDRIAPKYAKQPISNIPAYETTLERVRSYLKATDRVIEFGAGTGSTALRLAPHVSRYLATDLSPGMAAIGEEKRRAEGISNLRIASGVVADFTAEDVTVALGFNVFHLVDDPKADFERIYEMLPSAGLFISKTPAIGSKWYFRPLVRVMQAFGKAPRPVHFLSVEALDAEIRAAGFEIVETGLYPPETPSRFIVARKP
ncbi:methyltransferase domain-containing protein [Alphaproteobacteria bacterium GH1-50]|uniref:Methyltransferase domain-containing protein n=1 Tax=Kangsaoukella pontilimi TaxID=2691042 RepID=A0A7C9IGP8_9RHOB|nr:class I SAM-dependent methyltransferase [Kangsaoukella pontilimi]MXQ07042.1 methyltransferase domain-containing protein [Kangsaoukella pontilimi]